MEQKIKITDELRLHSFDTNYVVLKLLKLVKVMTRNTFKFMSVPAIFALAGLLTS